MEKVVKVRSEDEMLGLGRDFAAKILGAERPGMVFELVGDVGAGKTTFTRGLAEGLGVSELVTSPSFTISKRYDFGRGELVHYDFYRLDDPGIMRDELAEALAEPDAVVVVEWGGGVADLLPGEKVRLELALCEDGSREVKILEGEK